MALKLSRGEFWILGIAINAGEGLEALASDEEHIAGYWNRETHGMDLDSLVNTLCGMFEKKWLEIRPDRPECIDKGFIPNEAYVRDIFYGDPNNQIEPNGHYFYLTPEGGKVWEAFAAPEWQQYVYAWHYGDDKTEVIAATKDLLDEYLSCFTRCGSKILFDTLQLDTVSPWDAKYWKQLPIGYRARFNAFVDWDFGEFNYKLSYLLDRWVRWK